MKNPIENIDFNELRLQKLSLLTSIDLAISPESIENLTGILNLIDSIQDFAVSDLGKSELEVFNLG